MRISNPKKFTSINLSESDPIRQKIEQESILLTLGDALNLFSAITQYSENEKDWHKEKTSNDQWIRYSFDGGRSWILQFKFNNQLTVEQDSTVNEFGEPLVDPDTYYNNNPDALANIEAGCIHKFDFSNYTPQYYESLKKAFIAFFAENQNGYLTSLPNFRYKFDENQILNVAFLENLPLDTVKIKLKCLLNGNDALVLTMPRQTWTNASMNEVENSIISDGE